MSDDLVKRLRRYGQWIREDRNPSLFNLVTDEAADRIEALEEALRLILDNDRNLHRPLEELFAEFCIKARAALGEKKDD